MEVQLRSFLTLTLDRGEWSATRPADLHLGKEFIVPTEQKAGWGPSGAHLQGGSRPAAPPP